MHGLRAIPTAALCLLLASCQGTHGLHVGRAGAPGLEGAPRNAANPNAPFAVRTARPQLRQRDPLLDVNGVPQCEGGQLTLFESGAGSNENHHVVRLSFENSGEACRLSGFPTVTLMRADGAVAGSVGLERISEARMAATLSPGGSREAAFTGPSPQVLLPAHGTATFQLGWTTGPECVRISRVAIGAPGTTKPVVLARPLTVCEDRILITAVAPAP